MANFAFQSNVAFRRAGWTPKRLDQLHERYCEQTVFSRLHENHHGRPAGGGTEIAWRRPVKRSRRFFSRRLAAKCLLKSAQESIVSYLSPSQVGMQVPKSPEKHERGWGEPTKTRWSCKQSGPARPGRDFLARPGKPGFGPSGQGRIFGGYYMGV